MFRSGERASSSLEILQVSNHTFIFLFVNIRYYNDIRMTIIDQYTNSIDLSRDITSKHTVNNVCIAIIPVF